MKRLFVLAVLLISLSGCALRGVYEVAGVRTADALSETPPMPNASPLKLRSNSPGVTLPDRQVFPS